MQFIKSLCFLLIYISSVFDYVSTICSTQKQQRVLLISFDGFRYDYIERYNMMNLKMIVENGVKAKYLNPQFTTQTYPNHWSIATGLYEESHGIVSNTFFDPLFNETFTRYDTNLKWWNATEPIWFTLARNNLKSGTCLWPGGDVIYFDTPLYTHESYNEEIGFRQKIDKVIEWFTKENFIFSTIYDPQPDHDGHFFGLDSSVFNETIKKLDEDVGYLISKLKEANLYDADDFNLIMLSDHGMSVTTKIVVLDDYIGKNDAIILASGGNTVQLKPYDNTNLTALLEKLNKMPNVTVIFKKDMPEEWHYKNNRRVGDIMLIAQEGTGLYCYIDKPNASRLHFYADHGYLASGQNMKAYFVAKGAMFKTNYESAEPIQNVDVYPLVCNILNIKCMPNNGTFANVEQFLVKKNPLLKS